jgi:hypothetical protein
MNYIVMAKLIVNVTGESEESVAAAIGMALENLVGGDIENATVASVEPERCEACDGTGWLETTEEGVERCDSCKQFPNDEAAQQAYRLFGRYTYTLDNMECRDVLNALAHWTDDLRQRELRRAAGRISTLLDRLLEETRHQQKGE